MTEEFLMKRALELARQGQGYVSPNPMVGCVIVKDDTIIGEGYHQRLGEAHAEINALREAGELARGATMYVSLEPCCHVGRTNPCTEAIIKAGIQRVVAPHADPNPKVNGSGFERLRESGIIVDVGLLADDARQLNETFIWFMTQNRPLVSLKLAATLDGKLATQTGSSQWITGSSSRKRVHEIRRLNDGIVTGVGSILHDDPALTVREAPLKHRQPIRLVLDSRLRIPLDARILQEQDTTPTIVVTTTQAQATKIQKLKDMAADVWIISQTAEKQVDLNIFLERCGQENITSLLFECGSHVATSLLRHHLINKLYYFIAPKIAGEDARSAFGPLRLDAMDQAIPIQRPLWEIIETDILLSGYLE